MKGKRATLFAVHVDGVVVAPLLLYKCERPENFVERGLQFRESKPRFVSLKRRCAAFKGSDNAWCKRKCHDLLARELVFKVLKRR
jgi:hypothetical protein